MYNFLKRKIREFYKAIRYHGNKVNCPFCGYSFSKFLPTGALNRSFWKSNEGKELLKRDHVNVANAKCPICGSGERHRLLYFYLLEKVKIMDKRNINLLDVAPDNFIYDSIFKKININYYSIDIKKDRNPTHLMDIKELKFSDNYFDIIICYHVLEHIKEDTKAMKELFRVLKPGGFGILQVPIWANKKTIEDEFVKEKDYELYHGHKDHVRRYGLDYAKKLKNVGFDVKIDKFSSNMPLDVIEKYGIFKTEDLYIVNKK
jgi:SAM-dependent methyltransferase